MVAAIPWGIIFLIVFLIASIGIKQQIKESIQFATRMAIYGTSSLVLSYPVFTRLKQNAKEGAEFAAKTARNELRNLLHDPQVKKDLKEVFEYWPEKKRE